MQFQQELAKYSKDIQQQIGQYQQNIVGKLAEVEKGCVSGALGNEDRFVDCMTKNSKKIAKQQKILEFKLIYFQKRTYSCFEKQSNTSEKNYDICKKDGQKDIKSYFDQFSESF